MIIDEPITLENYNPRWPAAYHAEVFPLLVILGDNVLGIEHIGSTAIPSMIATPIIDIMIGVRNLCLTTADLTALETLGYEYLGESEMPGRLNLRKRHDPCFNLSIVKWGSNHWSNNIAFRDYLRTHPLDANKYAKTKQKILARGYGNLLAYSHEKNKIIEKLFHKMSPN